MPIRCRIGKLEKQRPQQRQSCMRILFRDGVEVRKQAVACLDEPAPDIFLRRPIGPHFVIPCSLLRVIPIDRLKRRNLNPLGEQFGRGRSGVTSDICAGKGESAQPQIFQHRRRQAQMIPGGRVVPCPRRGIPLSSRIRSAGQTNGRTSGFSANCPSNVAREFSIPYTL